MIICDRCESRESGVKRIEIMVNHVNLCSTSLLEKKVIFDLCDKCQNEIKNRIENFIKK